MDSKNFVIVDEVSVYDYYDFMSLNNLPTLPNSSIVSLSV